MPADRTEGTGRDWCEEHNRGSLAETDGICPDCERVTQRIVERKATTVIVNRLDRTRGSAVGFWIFFCAGSVIVSILWAVIFNEPPDKAIAEFVSFIGGAVTGIAARGKR